jgi:hypothetical protein
LQFQHRIEITVLHDIKDWREVFLFNQHALPADLNQRGADVESILRPCSGPGRIFS